MNHSKIKPVITEDVIGKTDPHQVFNHPAYGVVTLSNIRIGGDDEVLFGSDIGHMSTMRITVHRAELARNINRDWIHQKDTICEFELSHAQFAEFITGVGKGSGTPITLISAPNTPSKLIPGIDKHEEKSDILKREIKEFASSSIRKISNEVDNLQAVIDSGKLPKKEIREIARLLKIHLGNLPGNMEYVVNCAEEALDKATTDAKIEVESFISNSAKRIGLNRIQDLLQIEDKENKD